MFALSQFLRTFSKKRVMILNTARTMLIAAGLPAEALVFRDAREAGWKRGLEQSAAILCDAYTATVPGIPKKPQKIVFRLLAESAGAELGGYARQGGL